MRETAYASNVYWVFGIVAPSEKEKQSLLQHLSKHMIGSRPFFWCMHEQPLLIKKEFFKNGSHPVAERLARNGFYIPSGRALEQEELETVVKVVKDFFK